MTARPLSARVQREREAYDQGLRRDGDGDPANDIGDGDPTNDDTDGDGIPNYLDTDNTESRDD